MLQNFIGGKVFIILTISHIQSSLHYYYLLTFFFLIKAHLFKYICLWAYRSLSCAWKGPKHLSHPYHHLTEICSYLPTRFSTGKCISPARCSRAPAPRLAGRSWETPNPAAQRRKHHRHQRSLSAYNLHIAKNVSHIVLQGLWVPWKGGFCWHSTSA